MNDSAEFRHFKYLLAVAEQKGFRAAAEKLNTSQPSLSRQAKEFQEAFQIRLFKKTKSGRIRLTPAGEAFIAIARDLLQARDEAIAALISIHRGESSVFRIGCTSFSNEQVCRDAHQLHKQLSPATAVWPSHSDTSRLLEQLASDKIDVAVVTLPINDERFRVEKIKDDKLVVCLPKNHVLAAKPALSAADLQEHLTIFRHPEQHPEAHLQLLELLVGLGVRPEEHSHASHPEEAQRLVKEGHGFTLVREGSVIDRELTTRPILGVEWVIETAVVFKSDAKLKTVPILVRSLVRKYVQGEHSVAKKSSQGAEQRSPIQMSLPA